MLNSKLTLQLFVFAVFGLVNLARADEPDTVETRLREALRNAILQLRDTQGQLAALQAAQVQSDKDKAAVQAKNDALSAQIKTLVDQAAADKADAAKTITNLSAEITDWTDKNGKLKGALTQNQAALNQETQLANSTEAARIQLTGQVADLNTNVSKLEMENITLYQVGNEILTRYEHYGLGDAISAKEPFVGLTRAQLQIQVQDYKDKLVDHSLVGTPKAVTSASVGNPSVSASPR